MAALDVKFFLWRARMGIQRRDGDTAGMKPVRNGEVQSKKTSPFLLLWYLCQISSDFANFGQKHTPRKFETKRVDSPIYISFYMFVGLLYLVKTSDASQGTVRRWPLPVHLVIEPESRNCFKSLFKPLTFQSLSEHSQINFLLSKTLHLYIFLSKCEHISGAWLLHDLVWSVICMHQCIIGEAIDHVAWTAARLCETDGRDFKHLTR